MVINPESLIKPLISWFAHHQSVALKLGQPLRNDEIRLAERIGCAEPRRVRIHYCQEMPAVKNPDLIEAFAHYGFHLGDATGLCLGYGIYIDQSQKGDRRIIAHELTHTLQFERFGGTQGFLMEYISQFMAFGYQLMPLEKEARKNERLALDPQ